MKMQNSSLKKSTVALSKSLTQMLRHDIISEGLSLDSKGYVAVSEVLGLRRFKGLTFDMLDELVKNDSK